MKFWRTLLAVVSVLLACGQAWAQSASRPAGGGGEDLRVYLVTFGPGNAAWEKFGHNAIWVRERGGGDVLYNWGVFDFGEGLSGFLAFTGRFIQGKLWYSMQGDRDAAPILDAYASYGRSVMVQELNLSAAQKAGMLDRLRATDTEANRYYLYDYYKNNCSTKTRDAIDEAVGGRIRQVLEVAPTPTSFRWHTRRLTADEPVLYTALYYILGQPIDRPISAWEESFLPGKFANHLRGVTVKDDGGADVPLVKAERVLYEGAFTERDGPPEGFVWGFLAVGVVLGAVMYGLAKVSGAGRGAPLVRRFAHWGFAAVAVVWSLIAGFGGSLAVWGWGFTDHTACRWNENILQCGPWSLLLVVLAPGVRRWPAAARRVAVAAAGLSAAGLVLKILPWFAQANREVIALALPAHVGLAMAVAAIAAGAIRNKGATHEQLADDGDGGGAGRGGRGGRVRAEGPAA